MKKIFSSLIVAMLCASIAFAGEFGGTSVINTIIDTDDEQQKLETDLAYVAGWYKGESFELYSVWDQETNTIEFEEANIKFALFDLNWAIGQKAVPIGFMHLQRPETSVFITAPRADVIRNGLHLDTGFDIIQLEGMYWSNNDINEYVIKGSVSVLDEGVTLFISYNDSEELRSTYGEFVTGGLFRYESLAVNLSLSGEYMPDNGNFWAKGVTNPGFFSKVGLFAGYYNLANNEDIVNGYTDFVYNPDAWVYGAYMDLSKDVTASLEYKIGEEFNPIVLQFTATF